MVLVNTVNAETQRVHQSGAGCGQADRKGKVKGGGDDVRGRFIVCRARRIARVVYPPGKGSGGSNTKGCFNSLLSSVAEQEEEKVTPPVRNYLANLWRMRARVAHRSSTRGRKGRTMPRRDKEREKEGCGRGEGRERSGFLRESDSR